MLHGSPKESWSISITNLTVTGHREYKRRCMQIDGTAPRLKLRLTSNQKPEPNSRILVSFTLRKLN
jgi:hypothetical protein